jgi:hypothetical protein
MCQTRDRSTRCPTPQPRLQWLLLVAVVALSGCASAQSRLERGLMRAGVPGPVATCMAGHMADRLSTGQLRRVGSLRRLDDDIAAGLTLDRFLDDIRALRDPEILAVSSAAAVVCWATRPSGAAGDGRGP